jgi:cation diffusion facilitator family transporter
MALFADGIDAMGDSMVSLFVWFGLRLSRRMPDNKFHFGYYRMETLFSLLLSLVMLGVGAMIAYNGYLRFLNPEPIKLPLLAAASLAIAGTVSLAIALYKRKVAKTFRIMSMNVDASNSIKDASASFIVLASVILSSLGFHQMDAVGAMIIAVYLFNIAITTLRESSLILVDAFNDPDLVIAVREILRMFKGVSLRSMRMRNMGSLVVGEIVIVVDGRQTLNDVQKLKSRIRGTVMSRIEGIHDLLIVAEPMCTEQGF